MTPDKATQIPSGPKADPPHEPRLEIALLGQFLLRKESEPIPLNIASHQALLAYLVIHAGQHHTRQHLAFKFWPDSTESQALTNLRKALHVMRQELPDADAFLEITRRTVEWRTDAPCSVDVWDFESAVTQAQQTDFPAEQQACLKQAINVYQGDFLRGFYDDWVLLARETYRSHFTSALEKLLLVNEDQRRYAEAITLAEKLLGHDPLNEAAYRRLMRLQSLNGNPAGALRTYHICSTTLQRELGVNPGPATQDAYERLLQVQASPTPLSPTRLPLIARQNAWNRLQAAWKQSTRGSSKFFLITGEAGIGKTRLAEEMIDWAQRQGIIALSASCYAAGANLPYGPIADWLRAADAENILAGLPDKWLVEISRVLPELALDRPDLAKPEPITESWQRRHLFRALALAILHPKRPSLLFIDDLQWCDLDTLEWLHFLLRFNQQAPFLLVGSARTEEVPEGHPLAALGQNLRQEDLLIKLELARLDMPATRTLAEQVTGQALEEEQSANFFNDTEGNPLFIVEMARAGWGEQAENHAYTADVASHNLARLPEKVHVVIQRRLAHLSPEARDLSDLAAIIGRFFTYELLAAASDRDEKSLVHALDELWQQRIIREQGTEAYDFSHDKLRQVAISSLSAARRRLLHSRVIRALENFRSAGRGVDDSRLGQHYAAAGRDLKALACFSRAAAAAQQIYAHQEALSNLQLALDLLPSTAADRAAELGLHEQTADVLAMMGCYDEARKRLQTAAAFVDTPIDHARLLRKQGDTWLSQRYYVQAEDAYNNALHLLEEAAESQISPDWWAGWINLGLRRGELLYFTFRLSDLSQLIGDLIPPIARFGQIPEERGLINLQIMYHIASKRYLLDREDIQRAERYLALAQKLRNKNAIAAGHTELGFMYLWADDPMPAVEEMSIGLDQAIECGNIYLQDQCLAYLMLAQRRLDNEEQIQNLVLRHHPVSAQAGNPNYRGVLQSCEAWLSYKAGDMASAVHHGQEALTTWGSSPYPFTFAALWPLIAAALQQGQMQDAVDYAVRLIDPSQRPLSNDLMAEIQRAIDAWDAGDTAVCRQHLQSAIALAKTTQVF